MNLQRPTIQLITLALATAVLASSAQAEKDPKALLKKVQEATGTYADLLAKKDVEYIYTYRKPSGDEDISTERYYFHGELSWASYSKTDNTEGVDGGLIQGWNGKKAWVNLNGQLVDDEKLLKRAEFLRKTNFYWFAMMQKLIDPGTVLAYKGTRPLNDVTYDLVELSFEDAIGDVKDIYLLYINPETNLIDQFLFTVMDFGVENPLLMEVKYKEVDGLKLPATRRYTRDVDGWDGKVKDNPKWVDEIMTEIKFGNGFEPSMFEPAAG